MPDTITWLHLSDLHARKRDHWDAADVLAHLLKDLSHLQREKGIRPDIIFFTGDAAFGAASGEKMPDQYSDVVSFLKGVCNAFDPPIPWESVYLVPGNHDVDRQEISLPDTAWLRDTKRQKSEVVAAVREGGRSWRLWMDRLHSYRTFLSNYGFQHLQPDDPHLIWTDRKNVNGVEIGIAGLNSAWSCVDDEDKGKLWTGADWQIPELKRRLGEVDVSFALIHHPSNWLNPQEDPVIGRKLKREFDFVLHGHEHLSHVDVTQDEKVVVSAGACYQCSWMPNGYNVGRVDVDGTNGVIFLRCWDEDGEGWVEKPIAGHAPHGEWPLPQIPALKRRQAKLETTEKRADDTASPETTPIVSLAHPVSIEIIEDRLGLLKRRPLTFEPHHLKIRIAERERIKSKLTECRFSCIHELMN